MSGEWPQAAAGLTKAMVFAAKVGGHVAGNFRHRGGDKPRA
jgi:hypothetical protein